MSLRQNLVIWLFICGGLAASIGLIPGQWLLLVLLGVVVGLVLPFAAHRVAPSPPPSRDRKAVLAAADRMIRWVGLITLAAGGFLLWMMLVDGQAQAIYPNHPWLASTSVYIAALPAGLGVAFLATGLRFMSAPSQAHKS